MNENQRMIIGETERAGLPISAPFGEAMERPESLRWCKSDSSFALEQWDGELLQWVEIPITEL